MKCVTRPVCCLIICSLHARHTPPGLCDAAAPQTGSTHLTLTQPPDFESQLPLLGAPTGAPGAPPPPLPLGLLATGPLAVVCEREEWAVSRCGTICIIPLLFACGAAIPETTTATTATTANTHKTHAHLHNAPIQDGWLLSEASAAHAALESALYGAAAWERAPSLQVCRVSVCTRISVCVWGCAHAALEGVRCGGAACL